MSSRTRKFAFPFLILIVLLFTAVMAGGTLAQPDIGDFIDLSITSSSSTPVPLGEPVIFDVELRNTSQQNLNNIVMPLEWDDASVSQVRMNVNQSTNVRTDGIRRQAGMVTWKGGLQKEGVLSLTIELTPAFCTGDDVEIALMGEAGPAGGEQRVVSSAVGYARCQGALALRAVDVVMGFDTWDQLSEGFFILAGRPAKAQISLVNKSEGRINALIGAAFAPKAGQEAECLLLPAVQQRFSGAPTIPIDGQFFGDDSFTYSAFMALEIEPGTTWHADLGVPMRGRSPGCEFTAQAVVFAGPAVPIQGSCGGESPECRYAGWTPRSKDLQALVGSLQEWVSGPQTALLVAPDLGDAPASENHFNIGMPPYGVDSGAANFPTVFNFNIGMPPTTNGVNMDIVGPFHHESRPLRLGSLSTREIDADLGPGRNINPKTGASNLDRRDDSLNFTEVSGLCQSLDFSVPLTVEEDAVSYFVDSVRTAYLNVFVDANGDGDWADAGQCNGQTAAEHVIINHPVDVAALGTGQHLIEIPANEGLQWDNVDQAWLRITLSDEMAPTPLNSGGVAHGDGRGPATGYLFGETEDYRLRVGNETDAVDQGSDLAVSMDGQITVYSNPHMINSPQIQATNWLTHTTMIFDHLVNIGDADAPGSKLIVQADPALRNVKSEITVNGFTASDPDNLDFAVSCASSDPDCRVEVNLGILPPGRFGTVLVGVTAHCEPASGSICKKTEISSQATIEAAGESGGGNNQAGKAWELPLPGEWLAPPTIDFPIPGTTSNEELDVRGVGWPDRKVIIGVNGKKAGEDGDKDGPWKVTVAPGDGNYRIAASYESPGGRLNPAPPVSVIMSGGSTMIIDPMSLRVNVQHGNDQVTAVPWNESGRVDPNGWQLPLIAGTTAEITVAPSVWTGCLTCTMGIAAEILRPLTATLTLPNGQLLTTMAVGEEDGLLRGSFAVNSSMLDKPVSLNVNFEGVQQVYEGSTIAVNELPRIIDGTTGQPLKGAQVVLWQAAKDGDVDGADFLAWQRKAFVNGQPNPRITGDDGTFLFDVPPGRYRLEIIYDDNAPSFWTEPLRMFGIYPSRSIVIMPDPKVTTKSALTGIETVSISEDGFNPPIITAGAGSELEFVNLDLADRGAQLSEESLALMGLNASHAEAPFIGAGGRLRIRFSQPGSYLFEDPQDPQNKMTVIVEPGGANSLFLPAVMANK